MVKIIGSGFKSPESDLKHLKTNLCSNFIKFNPKMNGAELLKSFSFSDFWREFVA